MALVAVFAFSVVLVPAASAAEGGASEENEKPYATLIQETNKDNPLNEQATKQALARKNECYQATVNKETKKVKIADWSACLDAKVKARTAACEKAENVRQKNTCKLEVVKLTAAAGLASKNLAKAQARASQSPKEKLKNYQTCMERYVGSNNTEAIKKSASKAIDNRIEKITALQSKANMIPATGTNLKEKTQQELKSNIDELNGYKAELDNPKSAPADLARVYCGTIFKLKVTTHLNQKVLSLIALSKGLSADKRVMLKDGDKEGRFVQDVNQSNHSTIKNNPLKADMETRLNDARKYTNENISEATKLLTEVQNAKVVKTGTNYESTMPKDIVKRVKAIQAQRVAAWRNYNEAQVIRITPNYFGLDVRSQLSSVTGVHLRNANDNIIKKDGTVVVTPKNILEAKKARIQTQQKEQCSDKKTKEAKTNCQDAIEDRILSDESDGQVQKGSTTATTAYVKVKLGNEEKTAKLKRVDGSGAWRPTNR